MKSIFSFVLLLFVSLGHTQNPYFEISKQMEIFNDVLQKLSTNYIEPLNLGDLMQKNTKRMLNDLDRFTTFYDEQSILNQKMRQEGHFGGIGVSIRHTGDAIVITNILIGTPAEQSLKIGDRIIAIDGKKISEISQQVATALLSGPAGSWVNLKIKRYSQVFQKKIKRADIELNAVTGQYLEGDTGYIQLVKFNKKASRQVKKALLDLKQKGANKLIIDLRNNPGGLLNEVIKIVNFFIPQDKIVVTTKGRFEKYNKTYKTKNLSIDEDMPIVILVNDRSASASEILSGSLQDYDRAVIIGDTTYGKGLVQRTFKLKYGTYMKQTISKYYIPSGRLIQKIDYWHRNKNGQPLLMREHLKEKNYYTAHGRLVHNLGGVVPDIVINSKQESALIQDLIQKGILFDFATDYVFKHPIPPNLGTLQLTAQDFDEFLTYLKSLPNPPQTSGQKILKEAYKQAQKNHQDTDLLDQYKQLFETYKKQNIQYIKRHKSFILDVIQQDLVNRYFGKDSLIKYQMKYDSTLLKAKEILSDTTKYHQILNN